MSNKDDEQAGSLVKDNLFLRNLVLELIQKAKLSKEDGAIRMTLFSSMTDLLNYLSYKNFDGHFVFDFLQ